MKSLNSIQDCINDHKKVSKSTNGLIPFVCLFQISARKQQYGVNYLAPETEINSSYIAIDGITKATVIQPLF